MSEVERIPKKKTKKKRRLPVFEILCLLLITITTIIFEILTTFDIVPERISYETSTSVIQSLLTVGSITLSVDIAALTIIRGWVKKDVEQYLYHLSILTIIIYAGVFYLGVSLIILLFLPSEGYQTTTLVGLVMAFNVILLLSAHHFTKIISEVGGETA